MEESGPPCICFWYEFLQVDVHTGPNECDCNQPGALGAANSSSAMTDRLGNQAVRGRAVP